MLHGQKIADTILYVNGDFVKKSEAVISVYDSGFQHGDGVYEGIRAYGRKYTVWMSISNVCMSPVTRWESI